MKTVLVFAGTTEGRELIETFDRSNLKCHACVATDYGRQVLKTSDNIIVHTGRLDEILMTELLRDIGCEIIVDATHPYATRVTSTIKKCIEGTGIEYIRLERENISKEYSEGIYYYNSVSECAAFLQKTEGKILLTTGSKELNAFVSPQDLADRLVVRVIPGYESIRLCNDLGLDGKQILAMQGPFSQKMNETIIEDYEIEHLVTKESGMKGGVDSKIAAALKSGINIHIIKRPDDSETILSQGAILSQTEATLSQSGAILSQTGAILSQTEATLSQSGAILNRSEATLNQSKVLSNQSEVFLNKSDTISNKSEGLTITEVIERLEKLLKVVFAKGEMSIILAGVGPGNESVMTKETAAALREADIVFGAPRLLEAVDSRGCQYPYYLKEDILPILDDIYNKRYADTRIVILFSGDSGFYSGSRKLYEALGKYKEARVKVLAGISSVSYLCARFAISWQDAKILSFHGKNKNQWVSELIESVRYNEKTFFITSGLEDIKTIGQVLTASNINCKLHLGYRMSYSDEQFYIIEPKECANIKEEGLYSGLILNDCFEQKLLVPNLKDDFFIRDKIPMTKEEVRKLSVCQMNIRENDIIYDIGSGTGSIAIQVGFLSSSLAVYAVECDCDAMSLIKKNIEKSGLTNVKTVFDKAPDCLEELPRADVAFIGGSRGRLSDILCKLYEINPKMRIVMNAVSIESICEMNRLVKNMNISDLCIEQVSITKTRTLGEYTMLNSNNPVFIFSFNFTDTITPDIGTTTSDTDMTTSDTDMITSDTDMTSLNTDSTTSDIF